MNNILKNAKRVVKFATKSIKNTIMSNSSDKAKHADTVIRNHVIWSMGAGLIPVLIADIFAVSALQLDMIRQMCRVYDVDFSETQGKAIVTSLTSSTLARLGAGSLVKILPGVGSLLGGVTVSVFAGASTYALGEVFKKHFESGGTILDFDPARLRKYYKEKFEKGKKIAKEWQAEGKTTAKEEVKETKKAKEAEAKKVEVKETEASTPPPTAEEASNPNQVIEKLKELAQLKEQGIISDKEFDEMKKKLIKDF